jgi:hypothetical protein
MKNHTHASVPHLSVPTLSICRCGAIQVCGPSSGEWLELPRPASDRRATTPLPLVREAMLTEACR